MLRWLPLVCLLSTGCWTAPTPLAPNARGSVGLPHRGVLTEGRAVPPKGPGFTRYRSDGINWGNPRLVGAIARAAAAVDAARPGGAPLVVADLSAKHGGRIVRHRSHRTGRDADLLFYAVTPDGRPVKNPGFYNFGPDGLAETSKKRKTFVRLDVDRTWLLVRALATDEEAQVQWLFSARWLEALIIEHALALGEDDAVIARAQHLLHQPSDSFAHADHIHVRIACSPDETLAGCRGGGYRWRWLPPVPHQAPSDASLMAALLAPAPE